jgi:hypothetical protein
MRRFLVVRRFSVAESDMPIVGRRSRELVEGEVKPVSEDEAAEFLSTVTTIGL